MKLGFQEVLGNPNQQQRTQTFCAFAIKLTRKPTPLVGVAIALIPKQ